MTLSEEYELKRENFKKSTLDSFSFLCDEFNYEKPIIRAYRNNLITFISDEIIFENLKINRLIKISNGYHPKDYGFKIEIFKTSILKNDELESKTAKTVLQKHQDVKQQYLKPVALDFKKSYLVYINGHSWFENSFIHIQKVEKSKLSTLKIILLWILGVVLIFFLQKIFK